MSFLERAKQAAAQAAEQARQGAAAASSAAQHASASLNDPSTGEKARQALGRAKRSMVTAIDRIDPRVLADIVIKATSLQERANASLRDKGSPYRISQIEIGAAIPPSVTFAISRIDAYEEIATGSVTSTELATRLAADPGDAVRSLDGSTVEPADEDGPTE
jgi:hypothetical protein